MEGKSNSEAVDNVKKRIVPTMTANYMLWPMAQVLYIASYLFICYIENVPVIVPVTYNTLYIHVLLQIYAAILNLCLMLIKYLMINYHSCFYSWARQCQYNLGAGSFEYYRYFVLMLFPFLL